MSLAETLLLYSLPIPILAGAYWHWKVFGLYRRLGDRVRDIGYYWFSTQFQTPGLATQLYRRESFASFLPEDKLAEIEMIRREARPAIIAIALWMTVAVTLFFVSGWRAGN